MIFVAILTRTAGEYCAAVPCTRKGKLKPGEDASVGARREVMEETGYDVSIEGFLGSMSHAEGSKLKIVQFWRMRAADQTARKLMDDVTAVKWLPLQQAIDTLTRPHEKAFLISVGQAALQAAEPLLMRRMPGRWGRWARRWNRTLISLSVMGTSAGMSMRSRNIWRAWASS